MAHKKDKKLINPTKKVVRYCLGCIVTIVLTLISCYVYDVFLRPSLPVTKVSSKGNSVTDFKDKKIWEPYLGEFLTNEKNKNYFSLASTEAKALLKFHNRLLERKEVTFTFKPLSQGAINVVISVGDLYEIIIGDNNYKTISVKAHIAADGGWEFVRGEKSGSRTTDLVNDIRYGSEVIIKMNTEYSILDRNFHLLLNMTYIPTKPTNAGLQPFSEQYIFTPPFQRYEPLDISVGLINPNYQPGIAAEFISFEIEK